MHLHSTEIWNIPSHTLSATSLLVLWAWQAAFCGTRPQSPTMLSMVNPNPSRGCPSTAPGQVDARSSPRNAEMCVWVAFAHRFWDGEFPSPPREFPTCF